MMRLLADTKANENAPVVWQYGPLVQAGWATERDFLAGARRTEQFLIATEGSSDVHILKHALALLRPAIADFFRFIDVSESHPFPGTGNLVKFAEGLAKIDVQNQVLFLFDNDAEGLEAHERLSKLTLPKNMRGAMLPAHAVQEIPSAGSGRPCYGRYQPPRRGDRVLSRSQFKRPEACSSSMDQLQKGFRRLPRRTGLQGFLRQGLPGTDPRDHRRRRIRRQQDSSRGGLSSRDMHRDRDRPRPARSPRPHGKCGDPSCSSFQGPPHLFHDGARSQSLGHQSLPV